MKDDNLKRKTELRRFRLKRNEDESGVSGTGYVAEGVKFSDGQCVINWLTDTRSIGIYHSPVEMIHIHGHGGKTVIEWVDEESGLGSGAAVEGSGENKEQKLTSDKAHKTEIHVENGKSNGKPKKTEVVTKVKEEVVSKVKQLLDALDEAVTVEEKDIENIENIENSVN